MSIKDTIEKAKRDEDLKKNPLLAVPELMMEISENLKKIIERISILTLKGDPGDDGDTPTNDEILALIKPLIPIVKHGEDGHTPTKEELLGIIKPLIPKVKDGHTPTDNELLRLIKPLIPKVENGKDGSSDTAEKVIEKIHDSKTKISKSKIEGLEQEILDLKTAISNVNKNVAVQQSNNKNGGGGMGNVQHESKAVSSSTTTISTTYKISGAGFAIWAYYQGQVIVRGTHYTVGTDYKTLTLTFTPTDSTTIDIIYIR